MKIDTKLAHELISSQFPLWKDLPLIPVARSGWDNRSFRLGDHLLVRIPSAQEYAAQVEKEQFWLPILYSKVTLCIPKPVAIGKPSIKYPWKWSVYTWIEGETAQEAFVEDLSEFAQQLAQFLLSLQRADSTNGPLAGAHSFYRGGLLSVYDAETKKALSFLQDTINTKVLLDIWEEALSTSWSSKPVWVHGDISSTNLLVNNGKLCAVIDFGQLAVGDPACDLAIAWTYFKNTSRTEFCKSLQPDSGTWARARAWALWKAAIIASGISSTNAITQKESFRILNEVQLDY